MAITLFNKIISYGMYNIQTFNDIIQPVVAVGGLQMLFLLVIQ